MHKRGACSCEVSARTVCSFVEKAQSPVHSAVALSCTNAVLVIAKSLQVQCSVSVKTAHSPVQVQVQSRAQMQ